MFNSEVVDQRDVAGLEIADHCEGNQKFSQFLARPTKPTDLHMPS